MAPETRLDEIERQGWFGMEIANEPVTAANSAEEETLFDYEDARDYDLGEGD
jgi:hypothetical protein